MLKVMAFLTALFVFSGVTNAEDKYLSLPKTEFDCVNHILYKNRAATIIDVSGEKTELNKLVFEPKGRYYFRFGSFPQCGSAFYIIKGSVQLSIPLNMIISINFNGPTCETKFKFMNEIKSVRGKYIDGEFNGNGDFGELKIAPKKIKEILFDKSVPKIKPPELNSQLVLKDGSIIPVREADMMTIDLFSQKDQDSFYINVYHTNTYVYNNSAVAFKKGVSDVSVPFNKISKLEVFPEKGELSLTLKSGKKTTGKFISNDENKKGTIEGFAGICDEGGFFVPIKNIKEYRFRVINN